MKIPTELIPDDIHEGMVEILESPLRVTPDKMYYNLTKEEHDLLLAMVEHHMINNIQESTDKVFLIKAVSALIRLSSEVESVEARVSMISAAAALYRIDPAVGVKIIRLI